MRKPPTRHTNPTLRPLEVKICGVRDEAGARACADANVAWAGLNRVPKARRCIDAAEISRVCAALGAVQPILVLRDLTLDAILAEVANAGVRAVQLHGEESPSLGAALRQHGIFVAKALHAGHLTESTLVQAWSEVAQRFVLDGREAGSGRAWAWHDLNLADGRLAGVPAWLAGGLNLSNITAAVQTVRPAGVDVASGVESNTTQTQDPAAIVAFVAAARAAARQASCN